MTYALVEWRIGELLLHLVDETNVRAFQAEVN